VLRSSRSAASPSASSTGPTPMRSPRGRPPTRRWPRCRRRSSRPARPPAA